MFKNAFSACVYISDEQKLNYFYIRSKKNVPKS